MINPINPIRHPLVYKGFCNDILNYQFLMFDITGSR